MLNSSRHNSNSMLSSRRWPTRKRSSNNSSKPLQTPSTCRCSTQHLNLAILERGHRRVAKYRRFDLVRDRLLRWAVEQKRKARQHNRPAKRRTWDNNRSKRPGNHSRSLRSRSRRRQHKLRNRMRFSSSNNSSRRKRKRSNKASKPNKASHRIHKTFRTSRPSRGS